MQKASINFVMFLRLFIHLSTWNSLAPTGQIFMKFEYF